MDVFGTEKCSSSCESSEGSTWSLLLKDKRFTIVITCLAVLLSTCILTGIYSTPASAKEAKTLRRVPYWIPWVGNIGSILFGPERGLRNICNISSDGAVSLLLYGKTYNVIFAPEVVKQIAQQPKDVLDIQTPRMERMLAVFKTSFRPSKEFVRQWDDVLDSTLRNKVNEKRIITDLIGLLEDKIVNLVSFAESPIDQELWERSSDCSIIKSASGDTEVRTNMV